MHSHLPLILANLGMKSKPRFSLEESADILGIRRDQVLDLLKRGKLIGVRASERRWGGVFAHHLAVYLEEVNAPRGKKTRTPRVEDSGSSAPASTPIPFPQPRPSMADAALPLPVPPITPIHDPFGEDPLTRIPVAPAHPSKPHLGF